MANETTFNTREEVDFVVIGSGSAGGILAKELSTAGFSTVVLEQGPYRRVSDFTHDELSVVIRSELHGGGNDVHGQTFRHHEHEVAGPTPDGRTPIRYARGVGGSSVHFSGNYWRFRPIDFKEHGVVGDGRLDSDVKLIWAVASNALINQHANVNRSAAILRDESKGEFTVVQDNFLTPTARFADLVLPACTQFETWGLADGWKYGQELILLRQLVPPLGESRSDYRIAVDTADLPQGIDFQTLDPDSTLDAQTLITVPPATTVTDVSTIEEDCAGSCFRAVITSGMAAPKMPATNWSWPL